MKLNRTKYIELCEYFLALLLWLSIPPYFVWEINNFQQYLLLIFVFLSFIISKKISKFDLPFFAIFFLIYTVFAIRSGKNVFGILEVSLLCCILLLSKTFLQQIFNKLIKLYAILIIPSIIIYILVIIFGISLSYNIINPLNEGKNFFYLQYPFLVTPPITELSFYFRFYGYFDEPGVVGTISGVLLLLNRVDLKKWETYPLLISGVFSFSLVFFILLVISIVLFQQIKYKIILISVLLLLGIYFSTNEIVGNLVFERIKIEDARLGGDNRTVETMDNFMKQFWDSDKLFWGYGNNYNLIVNPGGASYKDLIVNHGILGFSLFCIAVLLFAYKNIGYSKYFYIYIILFSAIMYQRPFINLLIYFILIFVSIFYLKYQKLQNNLR